MQQLYSIGFKCRDQIHILKVSSRFEAIHRQPRNAELYSLMYQFYKGYIILVLTLSRRIARSQADTIPHQCGHLLMLKSEQIFAACWFCLTSWRLFLLDTWQYLNIPWMQHSGQGSDLKLFLNNTYKLLWVFSIDLCTCFDQGSNDLHVTTAGSEL